MFRAQDKTSLHLVRHAEAIKNIENRHGGGDQTLTSRGIEQARNLGRYLLASSAVKIGNSLVGYQPEGRSEHTAELLSNMIKGRLHILEDISGIGLGDRAGLSEYELEQKYPGVAMALIEWRTGKSNLNIPVLPGGESMDAFSSRIRRGIKAGLAECRTNDSLVIVGTTSTLVMMNHLLQTDGNYINDEYMYFDAPLGSVSTWMITNKPPQQISDRVIPGGY